MDKIGFLAPNYWGFLSTFYTKMCIVNWSLIILCIFNWNLIILCILNWDLIIFREIPITIWKFGAKKPSLKHRSLQIVGFGIGFVHFRFEKIWIQISKIIEKMDALHLRLIYRWQWGGATYVYLVASRKR